MRIQDAYAAHRDKFQILAIHDTQAKTFEELDQKTATTKAHYWGGRDLPFPILLDATGETLKRYGINGFPTMVLIDPEGKVVGQGRGQQLIERLPKLPIGEEIAMRLGFAMGYGSDGESVESIVKFVGQVSGIPIVLDVKAAKAKGTDVTKRIEFSYLGAVSWRSVLNAVLGSQGLTYRVQGNGLVVEPGALPGQTHEQAYNNQRILGELARPS